MELSIFWCPEEDAKLPVLLFIFKGLFSYQNSEVVPKAVPVHVYPQSNNMCLEPRPQACFAEPSAIWQWLTDRTFKC
ncbi:MAG: hypothetical protein ABF241_07705, partial [Yoonia sp.]